MLVFALCAACGGSLFGQATLTAPPPGSGGLVLEMEGDRLVAHVWRIDSDEPVPSCPEPAQAPTLRPPVADQVLRIRGGQLVGAGGRLIYRDGNAGPQRYANVADGRHVLFDLLDDPRAGCWTSLTLRAAFGTTGPDSMEGIVFALWLTDCLTPQFLVPNPNGTLGVRLWRAR
ncbi:MAG: hypothetical protein Fur0037_13330 [Planctomycetota bacterium]